ncbi:M23 family metallopeptidase [Patescibacteria group bacterium]
MKKTSIILIIFLLIIVLILLFVKVFDQEYSTKIMPAVNSGDIKIDDRRQQEHIEEDMEDNLDEVSFQKEEIEFISPLDQPRERITKKKFGQYITRENSPVQPERFTGFHTGVDFELFSEELDIDVVVRAVCSGKLVLKRYATGYGGAVVQECKIDNEIITIVYGHLDLKSIDYAVDNNIELGETLGLLGDDKSAETDGERKHLHLAIHKGGEINLKGYVNKEADLIEWIDPCIYICK